MLIHLQLCRRIEDNFEKGSSLVDPVCFFDWDKPMPPGMVFSFNGIDYVYCRTEGCGLDCQIGIFIEKAVHTVAIEDVNFNRSMLN